MVAKGEEERREGSALQSIVYFTQITAGKVSKVFVALRLKSQREPSNFLLNRCPCPGTSAPRTWRSYTKNSGEDVCGLLQRGLGQEKGQWPTCVSRNLGLGLATFGQGRICALWTCLFLKGGHSEGQKVASPTAIHSEKCQSFFSSMRRQRHRPKQRVRGTNAHRGLMWQ